MPKAQGKLYLVSTPIGNLEDITLRALRILKEVDLIACEDTRHTRLLLNHFETKTHTVSYHEHNELTRSEELLKTLLSGKSIAIVSDAGTPLISDPGFRLVEKAIGAGVDVVPIPGVSALVTALSSSGLATDAFYFGGFLPARRSARRATYNGVQSIEATLIFYETPRRLSASIADALEMLGNRKAVVARELTKLHEEIVRGTLSQIQERFSSAESIRGEIVLIIDRGQVGTSDDPALKDGENRTNISVLVARYIDEGSDRRAALKRAARDLNLTRSEAYRLWQLGQRWQSEKSN
ncbi:MAG: 16S rRNA (cytidine(1402)-2'-O)-methyltransferase [Pyrinomonadaceae bacterium]